jgi:hypothetical protein
VSRTFYDTIYRDHEIEWHCPGRHGVIRNVIKNGSGEAGKVIRAIDWFFGCKGQWWKNSPGKPGFMDVEFVHMTKTSPPPRAPWDWCGTSVLHETENKIRKINQQLANMFPIGQKVSFIHKNRKIVGFVCNKAKRATVLVPGEGKWHAPFDILEME